VVVPTPSIVGALKLTSSTYTPGARYCGIALLLRSLDLLRHIGRQWLAVKP
jgi:hypothetical protein